MISIASDIVIVFFITHRYDITLSIVAFTNIISTVLYFTHERLWSSIGWGKGKRAV